MLDAALKYPAVVPQIAELCEQGGAPLDVSTSSALSHSLEAAVRAAPDDATAALIKSLATRAMSEAEYLSSGRIYSHKQTCIKRLLQEVRGDAQIWANVWSVCCRTLIQQSLQIVTEGKEHMYVCSIQ